jgi:ABC-2 type transport system ATP-binding protein
VLLAQGSIDEVIAKSQLQTYTVSGADLDGLADRLLGRKGIDMVAPFGTSLHVAGRDAQALEEAIAPFKADPQLNWVPSPPSLEDVFIDLMARSQDNFQ